MSTLAEKIDKQFTYQRTVHATSGDPMDLFVSVSHLADVVAGNHRGDRHVWTQVKAELERRADAGEVHRWTDVHGPSQRADRVHHYFLPRVAAATPHPDAVSPRPGRV